MYYISNSVELHYMQITQVESHRCAGHRNFACTWPVADDRIPLATDLIELQMYYIGAL
nr:hypothetical protein SYMBAF_190076 [Serratia symbiotica]